MVTTRYENIISLKTFVARRSRSARAKLFWDLVGASPHSSVVDLGGGKGRHMAQHFPELRNVTVADFNSEALAHAARVYGFKTRRVDGSERLPFKDAEFDVVFCSSVIEHVTGPKEEAVARFKRDGRAFAAEAWGQQMAFAEEVRRSGRAYFVQTPSKWFPVEVHSWLPFTAALPSAWQWAVMKATGWFWPRQDDEPDWNLLSYRQMRELFPDAIIHRERWFGLTKSYIAVRPL